MTKLLLDNGASIDLQAGNARSRRGKWSPLFAAASLGQAEKALHLLGRGAGFGPAHQSNTGEVRRTVERSPNALASQSIECTAICHSYSLG